MQFVNFWLCREGARVPRRATPGSAGFDLYLVDVVSSHLYAKCYVIQPGSTVSFDLGIKSEFDPTLEAQIRPRSSLAKKGLVVAQGVGTIDSDYRGEWKLLLHNRSDKDIVVKSGDRVAQVVFAGVPPVTIICPTTPIPSSERGSGGFGSTGK